MESRVKVHGLDFILIDGGTFSLWKTLVAAG